MILHTVKSSPFQTLALHNCLNLLAEADTLLLIEDAVIACCVEHNNYQRLQKLSQQGRLMVLSADLEARAVNNNIGKTCSYPDFVNLVIKHKSQLSW
ncbi:sulfurtransferase complex subunit TusB [Psychromonas ossibalaenae]|uniref:sulfurtransferase complex subunit TusB n=1 Tax=Psychromonas ossibalaenae TaxID=444922 RepID=UPI000360FAED|nr:sulfurtransferase complex subunit TusB [Psychromonas ossibalaenae]